MRNEINFNKWIFSDDSVREGDCYLEQALPSTSLGYDTLEATVRCQDRSIVTVGPGEKMVWFHKHRQQGIFYVQSIDRVGSDRYTLSGISGVGRLAAVPHPGGIYSGEEAKAVIEDICGDIPVIVKTSLQNIQIYGWLPYARPPQRSARDNLAQVLFALGAYLDTDLDGVLRVVPLFDGISNAVDYDRVYQGGSVVYDTPVSAVSVTEHQYIAGGDEETLFEGTAEDGHLVTFDEPHSSLKADGFSIQASGANWARLSAGAGTLTGKAFIHTTRLVTEAVSAGAAENVKSVTDCTLVSLVNSNAVAKRLARYYRCTERIQAPILVGTEHPGQMVAVYNPYDKVLQTGCIVSMDVTMSGVLKGETDILVGFTPPRESETEYFDRREIFVQSSTFRVPDGVSSIRVVLIGGGSGGAAGKSGEKGTRGGTASITGNSGIHSGSAGTPGKGGSPGPGGAGGKINVTDLRVSAGDDIQILIGAGGSGESNDAGQPAGIGGETAINVYRAGVLIQSFSSADGASSPLGYIDAVTGDVYATSGDRGIPGADGGNAGDLNTPGSDGDSVDGYPGGAGRTSPFILSSSTEDGPLVFKNYTQSSQLISSEAYSGSISGYSSYQIGSEGTFSISGYEMTIGITGGRVVDGTVYKNPSNGSILSETTSSSIEEYVVKAISGVSNQCSLTHNRLKTIRRYVRGKITVTKAYLPSGGGGAAYGSPGGDATEIGGRGASAKAPPDQTVLGGGGHGGNGGGGGAAGGGGVVQLDKVGDGDFSLTSTQNGAGGGVGGTGSPGGGGCHGCAIFYFGEPQKRSLGQLLASDGQFFFDRLGRIFVV